MQAQGARSPNRLTELRERGGMMLSEVAGALRVDQSTVYRWEKGITPIPDDRKGQLAEMFGVTRAHLMGWDEEAA